MRIAEASGVPPFVIGATVVSVATTLPELLVSLMSAASGRLAMSAGNAVGSVTANTALILSLSIISFPCAISRRELQPKALLLFSSILLLWLVTVGGTLSPFGGAALMLLLILFIYENIRSAKRGLVSAEKSRQRPDKRALLRILLSFIFGAAAIILGSRLLVDNGTIIARDILHIDERVISLTLVAVGTSLPELVTAVSAAVKRRSSLAVGNIIGANIIDLLLIFPLCSIVRGGALPVGRATVWLDLPFSLLSAVIILVPALISGRFRRVQGIAAIILYLFYLFILFIK